MKSLTKALLLTTLLIGATLAPALAADAEHQHPAAAAATVETTQQEMMQPMQMMKKKTMMADGEMMSDMPCMSAAMPGKMVEMPCGKQVMMEAMEQPGQAMMKSGMTGMMSMDHGMHNRQGTHSAMMHKHMDHELFLDRIDALALSPEQVTRLKAIRSACRNENIRKAAEARIVKLELQDLLNEPNWSLNSVEPLIRKKQMLEGDMLLRHLQAVVDARKVLTAEQLQKATAKSGDDLEELFN